MSRLSSELNAKLENLFKLLANRASVVAFSGGVDSSVLAKALTLLYERDQQIIPPVGYFAESPTSTEQESQNARSVAEEIGLTLRVVRSNEFDEPKFVENSPKRCYWCKKIRFSAIKELAQNEFGAPNGVIVRLLDGSNADDSGDFRPGAQAARELGVESPLAAVGLSKDEIRRLAAFWNLSVADKPSSPCLATRVAYGLPLENSTLRQIESAELILKKFGATICRARVDAPGVLRIEVPESEIERFAQADLRRRLIVELRSTGFNFISLDLEGFYSGKNNRGVDAEK